MTTSPPRATAEAAAVRRPGGWGSLAVLSGTLAAALAVLYLRDPHVPGSYGFCPSRVLGFACPGCGGLRATHDLLHGDLAAAWATNPLAVVALPVLVLILVRWGLDARAGRPSWAPSNRTAWIVGAVLVGYGVARNLAPALLGPLGVS